METITAGVSGIRIESHCYCMFFEEDGFCCTISINDMGEKEEEAMLGDLLPEIQAVWVNRYGTALMAGGSIALSQVMGNRQT